jgi:carbon-monoxide dehydrogenase medium subunit
MIPWQNYHIAHSIQDALETITKAPGPARFVAGGTDLLLDIQQGRHPPVHTLVDVTRLPETCALEMRAGELFVGAAAPLNQVMRSPLVRTHARALAEASALIGGSQVRNTATLGGNVCHALPAGDGTIALLALGAAAEIAGPDGLQRRPVESLFAGPGRTALDTQREMLVGFYLPAAGPGGGSAHRRVMRPQGVAIAILNLAVWVQRREDLIQDIRIAIGPAGPTPLRARRTEAVLRGASFGQDLSAAVETLLAEARFRTSPHRASVEYRRQLAPALLADALQAAWQNTEDSFH